MSKLSVGGFHQYSHLFLQGLVASAALLTGISSFAADPVQLAKQLPSSSNAVAVLRVSEAYQSPRAIRENWARTADENFLSGAGGIPSWIDSMVVGFLIRPSVPEEVWAAAVASVPADRTVATIAKLSNASVEQLGGYPAVRGRGNSYVLELGTGLLGVWRPGIRQEAVRWANEINVKITGLTSEYLEKAVSTPGHLVMALDLDHAFDPMSTRAHLDVEMASGTTAAAREQLLALLMGIRGATLSVTVGETFTARLQMDFSENVGNQAAGVKTFFLNILNGIGASIEEFNSSDVTTNGTAVVLTTNLSDASLRRIMSLITMPHDMPNSMTTTAPATPTTAGTLVESRRYFNAIDGFVRDLERASRNSASYSQTALWHDKYARKINDLSTQGVAPELLEYGANVASQLRSLARSLQGQQMEVNAHESTLTFNSQFTPGWASVNVWGGVGVGQSAVNVTSNLQQVRERQAAAIIAGDAQRRQVWSMLTEERARILTTMQMRFGDDFIKRTSR